MKFRVVPIAERHIDGFHAALDIVARERRYLSFLEAPPIEQCAAFVRANIRLGVPQFVAVVDGKVVGWCDVIPVSRPVHAHTGTLGMGVIPGCRGVGIGSALIERALQRARSKGFTRVELTVREHNAPAIALYKKVGFVHEGLKRNAVRVDGAYENLICMAVLFDEPAV
jgi:ribosomal protein S18 acetylase RimI-like enzyme